MSNNSESDFARRKCAPTTVHVVHHDARVLALTVTAHSRTRVSNKFLLE